MFSLFNLIFERLIWKEINVYFLWFDYWILKEWKLQKYRIILSYHTSYLHKWLVTLLTCLLLPCLFFFCEIPKYVQAKNRLAHLDWHFMEWASMLTNLAGYDEYRLVRFHPIRNFLANEIYHLQKLSFLGSSHHVISFLFSHFCFFQNAILRIVLKLQFWILKLIFLRI